MPDRSREWSCAAGMELTRTVLMACLVVVLSAVLYGCAHDGDDPPATMGPTDPIDPDRILAAARAAARTAAEVAMAASGNANRAADGAEAATMNLVTRQTGAMGKSHAMDARKYADMATAAYRRARWASDEAAATADARTATRAGIAAEAARTAAEEASEMAAGQAAKATEAAMTELMVDATVWSVGETSVDVVAGSRKVSVSAGDDARTTITVTGLIATMNPMATTGAITGRAFVAPTPDDPGTAPDETAPGTAYRQAAAARTFAIGKTLDSSDDTARLMLVTHYADTVAEAVFALPAAGTNVTGTKAGYISIDDAGTPDVTETDNVALRSEGTFVPAGAADGELVHTDVVAADARPREVFSYVDPSDNTRKYAILTTTVTVAATGATTWTYAVGADVTAPASTVSWTARRPGAVAYRHVHFGVWAGLGEAARDGAQQIARPGIGFVRSIGDGMTGADMPVGGMAAYKGNWVATVRGANSTGARPPGLKYGAAELTAKFADGEITADLAGLATLEGSIDGSMFSGTRATVASGNAHGLTADGAFTGTFSGGFYGPGAAEAGGVFDFTSTGMKAGEFRGAFGGRKRAPRR